MVRSCNRTPEAAGLIGSQPENAGNGKGTGIVPDEAEVPSVETNQSGFGANPKIAVGSLRDGVDGAPGKALLGSPLIVDVLRKSAVGIDGPGRWDQASAGGQGGYKRPATWRRQSCLQRRDSSRRH